MLCWLRACSQYLGEAEMQYVGVELVDCPGKPVSAQILPTELTAETSSNNTQVSNRNPQDKNHSTLPDRTQWPLATSTQVWL